MSSSHWDRVAQIFDRACALPVSERDEYLLEACSEDQGLMDEVRSLLETDRDLETDGAAGASLAGVIGRVGAEVVSLSPESGEPSRLGQRFGAWELTELIDAGGMGTVYAAARADEAYRTRAAIKIIRGGVVDPETMSRFVRERQALATLNHPSIARLLDGGTTEDGLPYLVMELVDGIPIDRWCDEHRATLRERLEVFRQVCTAVAHAHAHLIIHRDIKPANILVTEGGTPKLLDFGIAKILDDDFEQTATGERILTPEYASPEQIQATAVTTVSDIYSLGVLLYQLLVGHRPFERGTQPTHVLAQRICEETPAGPSLAFSRPGGGDLARKRRSRPDRLRRKIAGDLDNIVLMALRKDPARRYATVEQFSADVGRYFTGMPVLARRDTFAYRTRKFVRRHRNVLAFAFLIVAGLGVGVARETRSYLKERQLAGTIEAMALDQVRAIDTNPMYFGEPAHVIEMEAHVDRVAKFVLARPPSKEDVPTLFKLARAYSALSLLTKSREIAEQILAINQSLEHPDELVTGDCYVLLGRTDDALEIFDRVLPPGDDRTLEAHFSRSQILGSRGDFEGAHAALEFIRESTDARPDSFSLILASSYSQEAHLLMRAGNNSAALEAATRALEIHPDTSANRTVGSAWLYATRSMILHDMGRFEEALRDQHRRHEILSSIYPPGHPRLATANYDLGLLNKDMELFEEAELLVLECIEMLGRVYESSEAIEGYQFGLGKLYADWGRWAEAEVAVRIAVDARHWDRGTRAAAQWTLLGRILIHQDCSEEAIEYLERAYRVFVAKVPPERWERQKTASILGHAYARLGRYQEAEDLMLTSVPMIVSTKGPDHYRTAQAYYRLVDLYERWGRPTEAERYSKKITEKARAHRIVRMSIGDLLN